jgi:hypothetical protein
VPENEYPPDEGYGDRLADWGYGVTVCIAALCNNSKSVVFVSDSKVDFGDFFADPLAHKYNFLTDKWTALFAGNDAEYAPEILGRARRRLSRFKEPRPLQVVNAVNDEIHRKQEQHIELTVLRKFGFTAKSFIKDGKRRCNEHLYLDLAMRVANAKISFSTLIGGFDPDGRAHLLTAEPSRAPGCVDGAQFWAIGTGRPLAMGSLAFAVNYRHFSANSSLEDAIFTVLEAKFMAEQNAHVGRATALIGFSDSGKTVHTVLPQDIAKFRQVWLERRAPLPTLPSLVQSVLRKDIPS